MDSIDSKKNKLLIQGINLLEKEENPTAKIGCMLKNYLELDNVNFLFGTGSSMILGARSIQTIPVEIEKKIAEEGASEENNPLFEEFTAIIKALQNTSDVKRKSWEDDKGEVIVGEIDYSLEKLLNYLLAIDFVLGHSPGSIIYKHIAQLIKIIKRELFKAIFT